MREAEGPQPLDEMNRRIISLLAQDGRMSLRDVANAVGRGESTVRDRVAALEQRGVLAGYGARVDWVQLGLPILVVVEGYCPPARLREFHAALVKAPHITEAWMTTGNPNIIALARARDLRDVGVIMEQLLETPLEHAGARVSIEEMVAPRPPALRTQTAPGGSRVPAPPSAPFYPAPLRPGPLVPDRDNATAVAQA